jgi:hypothetical protein
MNEENIEKIEHEELSKKQINAIKERAIAIWGDNWLANLVKAYALIIGANERNKFAQVQRYFKDGVIPNLDTMNALLMAVNCRFQMVYTEIKEFQ